MITILVILTTLVSFSIFAINIYINKVGNNICDIDVSKQAALLFVLEYSIVY